MSIKWLECTSPERWELIWHQHTPFAFVTTQNFPRTCHHYPSLSIIIHHYQSWEAKSKKRNSANIPLPHYCLFTSQQEDHISFHLATVINSYRMFSPCLREEKYYKVCLNGWHNSNCLNGELCKKVEVLYSIRQCLHYKCELQCYTSQKQIKCSIFITGFTIYHFQFTSYNLVIRNI